MGETDMKRMSGTERRLFRRKGREICGINLELEYLVWNTRTKKKLGGSLQNYPALQIIIP